MHSPHWIRTTLLSNFNWIPQQCSARVATNIFQKLNVHYLQAIQSHHQQFWRQFPRSFNYHVNFTSRRLPNPLPMQFIMQIEMKFEEILSFRARLLRNRMKCLRRGNSVKDVSKKRKNMKANIDCEANNAMIDPICGHMSEKHKRLIVPRQWHARREVRTRSHSSASKGDFDFPIFAIEFKLWISIFEREM